MKNLRYCFFNPTLSPSAKLFGRVQVCVHAGNTENVWSADKCDIFTYQRDFLFQLIERLPTYKDETEFGKKLEYLYIWIDDGIEILQVYPHTWSKGRIKTNNLYSRLKCIYSNGKKFSQSWAVTTGLFNKWMDLWATQSADSRGEPKWNGQTAAALLSFLCSC